MFSRKNIFQEWWFHFLSVIIIGGFGQPLQWWSLVICHGEEKAEPNGNGYILSIDHFNHHLRMWAICNDQNTDMQAAERSFPCRVSALSLVQTVWFNCLLRKGFKTLWFESFSQSSVVVLCDRLTDNQFNMLITKGQLQKISKSFMDFLEKTL